MSKQALILLLIVAAIGGIYFVLTFEVQTQYENGRAAGWKIVRRTAAGANAQAPAQAAAPSRATIRIATFHLGHFDDAKSANRRVHDVLLRLLPRFDLIAVQGVRGRNLGVLLRLVEAMSAASGRSYDFVTCPTQRRDALEHYTAFLYDRATIEVDGRTVHFVEDRLGRFRVKPLVGSFRVHGPDATEAFTFTLINAETDPDQTAAELNLLAAAFRAVRDDRPEEDDVILLGDLETDDQNLGPLGRLLGVTPLVSGVPTTVRGTRLSDNILLDRRATCEFTGRVEVVDLLREFGLSMPEAMEVSEHLPVFTEFSVYEGGQASH